MSTPCIVATGTRTAWRGVLCKMDGYEAWTGAYLVDRIARTGCAATAAALVDAVAHGWTSVGSEPIAEPDEVLGGARTSDAPRAILEWMYAVYVIDVAAARLEIRALADGDRWLAPATFTGPTPTLPAWYPQLGGAQVSRPRRTDALVRELQASCRARGLDWDAVREALRGWIIDQLELDPAPAWLYLGGESTTHERFIVGGTEIHATVDSHDRTFTSSDGKLRRLDIDRVDLAAHRFRAHGLDPADALAVLATWLTLCARQGDGDATMRAEWIATDGRWNIQRSPYDARPRYYATEGLVQTMLASIF